MTHPSKAMLSYAQFVTVINKVQKLGQKLLSDASEVKDIGHMKRLVAEVDGQIEREITNHIKTFGNEHAFYHAEHGQPYEEANHLWVIDPISNTFNFIHGLPHFALVVTYLYRTVPQFTVVYDPVSDETFTALKNGGVYLNGKRVAVGNQSLGDGAIMFYPLGIIAAGERKRVAQLVLNALWDVGIVRCLGSVAIHQAYVACGRAMASVTVNKDVYAEFAGQLLVEEAGGIVRDFDDRYLTPRSQGIIGACNRHAYREIFNRVNMGLFSA
jgi:myo-inositol-1(or 4)-monophosphatase